jgi:hypothetical protein
MGDLLVLRGYHVLMSEWYPIERYGDRHRWKELKKFPCNYDADSWGNFIAFREHGELERFLREFAPTA